MNELAKVLLIAVLIGLLPAAIAKSKGHNFLEWWFYGAALFIFALPHAIFLKSNHDVEKSMVTNEFKKCPFCAEEIQIAAIKCRYCGSELKNEDPVRIFNCTVRDEKGKKKLWWFKARNEEEIRIHLREKGWELVNAQIYQRETLSKAQVQNGGSAGAAFIHFLVVLWTIICIAGCSSGITDAVAQSKGMGAAESVGVTIGFMMWLVIWFIPTVGLEVIAIFLHIAARNK